MLCKVGAPGGEGARIPDGLLRRSIVYEFKKTWTIMATASGPTAANEVIVSHRPGMPASFILWKGSVTTEGIDGSTQTFTANGSGEGIALPYSEYAGSAGYMNSGNPTTGGFGNSGVKKWIRKARAVAWDLKVDPVAAPLTMSGAAISADVDMAYGVPRAAAQQGGLAAFWRPVASPSTTSTGAIKTVQVDLPPPTYSILSSLPTAVACPAASGCYLMGKTPADSLEPIPVVQPTVWNSPGEGNQWNNDTVLEASSAISPDSLLAVYDATGVPPATGVAGAYGQTLGAPTVPFNVALAFNSPPADPQKLYGNFWIGSRNPHQYYAATGLPAGAPITFTSRLCVECTVDEVYSSDRQFVQPTPKRDVKAVEIVQAIEKEVPASMPSGGGNSLWDAVARAGKGVASFVAGLGLPIASGIAGAVGAGLGALGY